MPTAEEYTVSLEGGKNSPPLSFSCVTATAKSRVDRVQFWFSAKFYPVWSELFFHTIRGREGSLQLRFPVQCFALNVQNASQPLEANMTELKSSRVRP